MDWLPALPSLPSLPLPRSPAFWLTLFVVTLRARTEELSRTVERLRNDPSYVEKLAREELGYVRPGETILKFPTPGR